MAADFSSAGKRPDPHPQRRFFTGTQRPDTGLLSHAVKGLAYLIFTVWRWGTFRIEIEGLERIPQKGPYIVAANHRSNLDPFLIGYVLYPRCLCFMAKHTLFKNPIVAFVLKRMGAFPVVRHRPDVGALRMAHACLRDGRGLVLFPEGTRRPGHHTVQSLKAGAAALALESGVPVLPVGLWGTDRLKGFALGGRRPLVRIVIGEPFRFHSGLSREDALAVLREKMVQTLETARVPVRIKNI